ncbi:DUF6603 domain-containing protein [Streptomyces sp. NPDC003691]
MDLDALKAHLTSPGDPPVLRATDTALPPQLADLLVTFPDGVCRGAAGSQEPGFDPGHTVLTLVLVCSPTGWPAGGRVTLTVTGVTVTVAVDGSAGLVLSGTFDTVDVVCTVTGGEDGRLTAAVRPRHQGAFAGALDELGERLGSAPGWQSARQGLRTLGLAAGDVAGFDLRLTPADGAVPAVHTVTVTAMAVVAALDLGALPLEIAVWLPDLRVSGRLRGDEPVRVRAVLESFGLPVSEVPAELSVAELSFAASLGRSFLVRLKATGDWGIGPFALTALSVALYYDPARGFVAGIRGTVTIGRSIEIDLSASQTGGARGGWTFSGGLAAGAIAMGDLVDALRLPAVPDPLRSLELTALRLSHTTGTEVFDFLCRGRITLADGITASLALTVTRNDSAVHYGGRLTVGDLVFDVVLDSERTGTGLLVAGFHSADDGAQVTLRDLVAHFSADLAAGIPDSLRIGLKDAKFVRVKPADGPAVFCVGVDLSASVELAGLPLVGAFLAEAGSDLAVDNVQILYSSGVFDTAAAGAANTLLARAGVVELPAGGLKAGPAALADLRIGGERTPVALGLPAGPTPPGGSGGSAPAPSSSSSAPSAPAPPAPAPAGPAAPAAGGVWFDVQKQLGVVRINRVGVMYQHNVLLFGLDAGVQLGPLTMSLDGLAAGSPLDRFAPVFRLDGLGIGYVAPPVEIEGALLHLPDDRLGKGVAFQFDGTATIALPDFSLAAVGSYAQLTSGEPSLFVFAQLEAPLVAAPPILVTGLMAGFGFNRELALPSAREVSGFPLLVLNKQGPDADRRPSAVLDVLEGRSPAVPGDPPREWIAPRQGAYWLALGIEFSVAEVVNAKVLLAAEFGQETALALLGIATLQLPMPAESATRTYVYAELGLEAVVRPLAGSFELAAQLAPVSYVLTPACRLTGGFAASFWFGDHPNAGQFVVTLGGYHPSFRRPAGYPDVPRLGIDWAVSDQLTITAQAYLAVTPSCAMAGGRLSIVFHAGDFRAWFTAQADVLLSWRPFFFTARISVSIGASYQINIGILHKTVSVTVGAGLELWGPPTGGSVTAHFLTFSKTIAFGPGRSAADTEALGWDEFADLLPKPADVVTIAPVNGVDRTADATDATGTGSTADAARDRGDSGDSGKVWYARARDLRLFTQSAVPASHLRLGNIPLSPSGPGDGPAVDIRPMDRAGLVGEHRLELFYEDAPASLDGWTATARTHGLPASLWGAPPVPFSHTPKAPGAEVLPGRPVGYDLRAPRPELAGSRGVFPLGTYTADEIPPGLAPLPSSPVPGGDPVGVPDDSCVERIAETDRGTARAGRDLLCAALADAGLFSGPADTLAGLAADAAHLYSRAPLTRYPPQD